MTAEKLLQINTFVKTKEQFLSNLKIWIEETPNYEDHFGESEFEIVVLPKNEALKLMLADGASTNNILRVLSPSMYRNKELKESMEIISMIFRMSDPEFKKPKLCFSSNFVNSNATLESEWDMFCLVKFDDDFVGIKFKQCLHEGFPKKFV